ncbi:MAG TPA: hypothetical protein VGP79_04855 [Bryobacteraceae bacterium]|jgi:hypothetical protein|nr:hypothetical protein [Bryobacteraceae bacterium]
MKIFATLCAVLLGTCAALSAHSSMDMVKFHSSNAFAVAGAELPAGDITIQMLESTRGNIVPLVRSDSGPQAIVLANRLNGEAPHGSDKTQVTFQRRGTVIGLDQIWLSNRDGFQVLHAGVE